MTGKNDVKQQCYAPKKNINVDILKVMIMPLIEQEMILKQSQNYIFVSQLAKGVMPFEI